MTDTMSRADAEQFLRDLAARAEDIVGTHIRGITFGHDDLRKLAQSVKVVLADSAGGEGSS